MVLLNILKINIPFDEPVIIIALVLLILLIGPVLFERLRIPSIVGLLLCGTIIGPNGFNLVSPDLEFTLLGTIGLLYLMFLAGLEIDLIDFIENKTKSIFVGLASFIIPFILGFLACRYILKYEIPASLLIAAMFSSHTLISYPLLGRLGIVNKSIVTVIVGATIIADVLALVAMEMITNIAEEGFEFEGLLILLLYFILFLFIVIMVIPRLARVFLNRYEGDLGVQYIFVLAMLFLAAVVARVLKIEPILGAFFCGLVLNRQIINTSPLYKRIEFIGNNLFIPFFLISIGILANFRMYLSQPQQIGILLILIIVAILGKYLASLLTRLVLRISQVETNLVFGLSVSRAASAIAIILIGFHMGIVRESVLNNTVILILVTSTISSYVTQKAGRKILLKGNDTISKDTGYKQKILVPVANPANMKNLLEFAVLIKRDNDSSPVYPLTVFTQREQVRDEINENLERIKKIIKSLHSDVPFETGSRIDSSVTSGIVRAAEELVATVIILGWNNRSTPFLILFGTVFNNLLEKTKRMILVLKTPSSFREVRRIHLFCTANAQYEQGFTLWLDTLLYLAKSLQTKILVRSKSTITLDAIRYFNDRKKISKFFEYTEKEPEKSDSDTIKDSPADLLIFVHSREKAVSYSRHFEHLMNSFINGYKKNDIIIIYPEQ